MNSPAIIVMGGSAGSIEALSKILPALPGDFPVPVLVVVHIPPDKNSGLASLFRGKCTVSVHEARDKQPLDAGTVYFAPPDYHLQVEAEGYISLSYDEPLLFSRPSIDVLFESAADSFGKNVIGVVLSGGNNDGAQGLQTILARGGQGLVQSPSEALTPTMPQAALKACPSADVRAAEEIAEQLKARCGNGN